MSLYIPIHCRHYVFYIAIFWLCIFLKPRKLVRYPRIYAHREGGKVSERAMKGKRRVETKKRAKRFRLKEEDDYLWDGWMVARPCHA